MGSSDGGEWFTEKSHNRTLQPSAFSTTSSSSFLPSLSCLLTLFLQGCLGNFKLFSFYYTTFIKLLLLSNMHSQSHLVAQTHTFYRSHSPLDNVKVCFWLNSLVPWISEKMNQNSVLLEHYPQGADQGGDSIPRIREKQHLESSFRVAMEKCSLLTLLCYSAFLHFTLLVSKTSMLVLPGYNCLLLNP